MSNPNLIAQTQTALDDAIDSLEEAEQQHREDKIREGLSYESVIARSKDCKKLLQALAALEGGPALTGGDLNAALVKARNKHRRATR